MLAYCCDSQPAEAVRLALIPDLRLMTCRISAGQSLGVGSGGVDGCLRGGHWWESRHERLVHIVADAIGTRSLIYKERGRCRNNWVIACSRLRNMYIDTATTLMIDRALEHSHVSMSSSPLRVYSWLHGTNETYFNRSGSKVWSSAFHIH